MSVTRGEPEEPRIHHQRFAHRVLPGLFFDNPISLLCLLGAGRALEILETVWRDVGDDLPAADRLPAGELAIAARAFPDGVVVVCTLPPPRRRGEAQFVAAAIGARAGAAGRAHEASAPGEAGRRGAGVAVRVFTLDRHEATGPTGSRARRRGIDAAAEGGAARATFRERTRSGVQRDLGDLLAPSAAAFAEAVAAAAWGPGRDVTRAAAPAGSGPRRPGAGPGSR